MKKSTLIGALFAPVLVVMSLSSPAAIVLNSADLGFSNGGFLNVTFDPSFVFAEGAHDLTAPEYAGLLQTGTFLDPDFGFFSLYPSLTDVWSLFSGSLQVFPDDSAYLAFELYIFPPPSSSLQPYFVTDTYYETPSGAQHLAVSGGLNLTAVPSVPVPAAIWLFGSGLLGLAGVATRKVRA